MPHTLKRAPFSALSLLSASIAITAFMHSYTSQAQEAKLTQDIAQQLITEKTDKWARCLNMETDLASGLNPNFLQYASGYKKACYSSDGNLLDAFSFGCYVTSKRNINIIDGLTKRDVVYKYSPINRHVVFAIKLPSFGAFHVARSGALCGDIKNTRYNSQVTRIEQTTDRRWEVTYSYKQESRDPFLQSTLIPGQKSSTVPVEYLNDTFVIRDQ